MSNFDKLNQYGTSFQEKLIASWMTDPQFLKKTGSSIERDYFDSDGMKWIAHFVRDYYLKYRKPPTFDAISFEIQEKVKNETLKESIVQKLRGVLNQAKNLRDADYIQDKYLEFSRNQAMKKAILDSVSILENGQEFEKIHEMIKNATLVGKDNSIGTEWKTRNSFEERNRENARLTIPTPWDVINDVMDGGLGKGELGIVVAPSGVGKSWILATLGAHAIKQGYNVFHYTLELDEDYVGRRYDSAMSGYSVQDIRYHMDDVWKKISNIKGNLLLKWYPTKRATVEDIEAHLALAEAFDFKPDMIIVDYGDLLRTLVKYPDKRFELEAIFESLRGMAGVYQVPVWTASQSSRASLEDEEIGADKISEAYAKIMIADFVISLSRKAKDKIAKTGRFHTIKNRFGVDGFTYPAKVDTATGQIFIYEGDTDDGKKTKTEMETTFKDFLRTAKDEFDARRATYDMG